MIKAQEWLYNQPEYNTPEKRTKVKELTIKEKGLEGKLDLRGFTNLRKLDCFNNQLTKIDIEDCPHLEELWCGKNKLESLKIGKAPFLQSLRCSDNNLTNTNFLSTLSHPEKLSYLTLRNNNFSEQNLSFLVPFKGLRSLRLGAGNEEKIKQGIYNRFYGSLEPLKDMINLEELWFDNTDINRGLSYLPKSLEKIRCSAEKRPKSKVKEITQEEEMTSFLTEESEGEGKYNLKNWRERKQDAQQWLDKEYPHESRKEIKELTIDKNLEGSLSLEGFDKLKKLFINSPRHSKGKLTSLDLTGSPKLKELECSNNSLETLNLNKNKELEILVCFSNKLTNLDVSDCRKLERVNCHSNQLEKLNLTNCSKLKILDCTRNQLKEFDISDLSNLEVLICANNKLESSDFLTYLPNPRKLSYLSIRSNNFSPQDLSFLSKIELVNVDYLSVSDNHFYGSLEFLSELTELRELKISNTDIESGLEYLPENVERIYCEASERFEARCQNIAKQLEDYWEIDGNKMIFCNYHEWKDDNQKRAKLDHEIKVDRKETKQLKKKKEILEAKINGKIKKRKEKLENWYKNKQHKGAKRQDSAPIFSQSNTNFLPTQEWEKSQEEIKNLKQQLSIERKELEKASQESELIRDLVDIVMPKGSEWEINTLRKEIEELKIRDLNFQKSQLVEKIGEIKKEVGENLEKVVELFLECQEMIIKEKREDDQFAKSQLETFRKYLTQEQVRELSQLQSQINHLEKQLTNLQRRRIKFEAQVEISLSKKV